MTVSLLNILLDSVPTLFEVSPKASNSDKSVTLFNLKMQFILLRVAKVQVYTDSKEES